MSLKIDRAVLPLNAVIQNYRPEMERLFRKAPQSTPASKMLVPSRTLILPLEAEKNVAPVKKKQKEIDYEEIYLLVDILNNIFQNKTKEGFGFKPTPKDEKEIKIGEKANKLANLLLDNPKAENIKAAKRFLKSMKLIDLLEAKAKERNLMHIGFNRTDVTEGDLNIAQAASKIAEMLKESDDQSLIMGAMELVGLIDLIETVENIANEKSRGTLGFKRENIDEDNEKIAMMAANLAEVLKLNPSQENVETAVAFINVVMQLDEAEKIEEITTKAQEPCYGFHCESPQYANAA